MKKWVPFKRFVQTYLFYGERLPKIIDRLKGFEFFCEESDLDYVLEECRSILPESLAKKFDDCIQFNPYTSEIEEQWLERAGILEFFNFIMTRKSEGEKPPYFKWFNDCLWIMAHRDIMCVVNILLFNGDSLDSISDLISCKYKKKIGIEALQRYKDFFWDTSATDAKDAMYFYTPFQSSALIIKSRPPAIDAELSSNLSSNDGIDEMVVFNDSNYIRWKIGYKKFTAPSAEDFLEQVRVDSMFKYYEAMNAIRSIEEEDEHGFNDKIGQFNVQRTKRRNVEEQKAKSAKAWFDLFMKANKAKKPVDDNKDEDVFKKMAELSMTFDSEKLVNVEDAKDMLEDIRSDL